MESKSVTVEHSPVAEVNESESESDCFLSRRHCSFFPLFVFHHHLLVALTGIIVNYPLYRLVWS